MATIKKARRHSFSSMEEVSKEFEGATRGDSSVDSPDNKEGITTSSRKRSLSPCARSEGNSPKRSLASSALQKTPLQEQGYESEGSVVCLPHGNRFCCCFGFFLLLLLLFFIFFNCQILHCGISKMSVSGLNGQYKSFAWSRLMLPIFVSRVKSFAIGRREISSKELHLSLGMSCTRTSAS